MSRTLLFVVGGLMLAGIIHIATVIMVPYFATKDAWAEMRQFGRDGTFHVVPQAKAGDEPLAALDPRMLYSVCRFSLEDGPMQIARHCSTISGRLPSSIGAAAMSTASTTVPRSGRNSTWR